MTTDIKVVIGNAYGDEGKGLMTDYFCNQAISKNENCIVVCSNGGSQRGHTVSTPDGKRHVFHHFGSGTFVGAATYLTEQFIVNPMTFRQEWEELERLGYTPQVFVHENCLWTTPFDMIINQIIEEHRGKNKHGSCGVGIWETIVRYQTMQECLIALPLNKMQLNKDLVKEYLELIRDYYLLSRLKELGVDKIPDEWKDIIYSDILIEKYVNDFSFFMDHTIRTDNNILNVYQNIVFENGQGLLLDQNIKGYGEHTTPSNTGLKNPKDIIESVFTPDDPNVNVEVCYITRTYLTRHGAGRFDTECSVEEINPDIVDLTNVPNPFQGSIRYGKIDLNELIQRIKDDFDDSKHQGYKLSLAITHLNETNGHFATISKDNNKIDYGQLNTIFDEIYTSDGMTRESVIKRIKL